MSFGSVRIREVTGIVLSILARFVAAGANLLGNSR